MNPKVSIITTNYNNADNLEKIISQVQHQDYENIEYIIVDGASTDRSMDVIEGAKEYFGERLQVLSEPDTGIYNALNKGIHMATGDIIGCCFDEYTAGDVISRMVHIMETEHTDGVHADLYYMEGDRIVRKWHQGQGRIRYGWLPGHPTLYLRRWVYDTYGDYKEDYTVSADYEFMVRILYRQQVKLSYIPEVLIHMAYGGTSNNSFGAYMTSLTEGHRALKENGVKFAFFTDICRTVKVLLQFTR
ncbi:MAG: glycosyltransferase family 2 protein [Lachnospiraceae bacterium]|nr:glycosyltransferase family 2 protein [Lachnospiraceae bacterium]